MFLIFANGCLSSGVVCAEPDFLDHGNVLFEGTNITDYANYTCDTNYVVTGINSSYILSHCLLDPSNITAQWDLLPTCEGNFACDNNI